MKQKKSKIMEQETIRIMEQETIKTTHFCGCCKQELPLEAFYYNKRKQCPDGYCRACRKLASRKQRKDIIYSQNVNNGVSYPVITCTEDPELRMSLIRHARQVVNDSLARKRRKSIAEELANEPFIIY